MRGKKVTIGDMTKNFKLIPNDEMRSLEGKETKILSFMTNVYDNKKYFRLAVDHGVQTWSEEMLIFKKALNK